MLFSVPSLRLPLAALLLAAAPAHAGLTVTSYGSGTNLPLQIGSSTISFVYTPETEGYYKYGVTASAGGFGRFMQDGGNCLYWFHTADLSGIEDLTDDLNEIYGSSYVYAGYTQAGAALVDGAAWSDDNFISYFDANGTMVAVLRFGLTEGTEQMNLRGMAYDPDGLTFRDGITATIPEPSGALLLALGTSGLLLARRERRSSDRPHQPGL